MISPMMKAGENQIQLIHIQTLCEFTSVDTDDDDDDDDIFSG